MFIRLARDWRVGLLMVRTLLALNGRFVYRRLGVEAYLICLRIPSGPVAAGVVSGRVGT